MFCTRETMGREEVVGVTGTLECDWASKTVVIRLPSTAKYI